MAENESRGEGRGVGYMDKYTCKCFSEGETFVSRLEGRRGNQSRQERGDTAGKGDCSVACLKCLP